MKIKRKVEMTLPQLIEWIEINRRFDESFGSDRYNYVHVNVDGILEFTGKFCEDTFTVTTEEEITEDTEFEKLYCTTILSRIVESSCTTIQSSLKHIAVEPIAFYIMNDDLNLTLIWRDGKFVE